MSWILSFLLFLTFGYSAQSAPSPRGQIIIQNVDIMTWPDSISASSVLAIFIEVMNSDLQAKSLLNKVNKKLNEHGISHVRDVFKYCSGASPESGAAAFFSQDVSIIETRLSIPGFSENPWSERSLATQRNAFSSKVLKAPFMEFLAISNKPQICIHKGKNLFHAYESIIHEMVHLLLKDPFLQYEELTSSRPLFNYAESTVSEKGGELDAFKIASSAGIRFFKKYDIQTYSSEFYKFFNSDGELINEYGLKDYIIKTYSEYYKSINALKEIKNSKLSLVQAKIKILSENVEPYIKSLGRADLQKDIADEIEILKKIEFELKS